MCEHKTLHGVRMEPFKPPEALKLSENWRRWVQRFDLYLTASGKNEEEEKVQCAVLLHLIGEDALEIYNNFSFASGESREKIDTVKQKFYNYFNPRKNTCIRALQVLGDQTKGRGNCGSIYHRLENTRQILRVR